MENKNTTSSNTQTQPIIPSSNTLIQSRQSTPSSNTQTQSTPSFNTPSQSRQSTQSLSSPIQSRQSTQSFGSPAVEPSQSMEMQSDNNVSPSSLFEINIEKPKGNMNNTELMEKMDNTELMEKKDTTDSMINRPDNLEPENKSYNVQNTISTNDFNKTAPLGIHDNVVKHSLHDNIHVQKISNKPSVVEEYRGVVIVKKESNKSVILKWIGWLILMCVFVIIILWWVNSFSSYSCSKMLDTGSDVRRYKKQVSWRKPLTQVRMFND